MSSDVEKKVVKNGIIPNKVAAVPIKSNNNSNDNSKMGSVGEEANTEASVVSNSKITGNVTSLDDLKILVEKQNDIIRQQRSELEVLRKQMEKNVHLTQDFQSELSEIRKNWQTLSENSKPSTTNGNGSNNSSSSFKSNEDFALRLEALSSAYTDIQDRLYELDKSWKNNLMIYGVPCCDGEEDDPIITEEKVTVGHIFMFCK